MHIDYYNTEDKSIIEQKLTTNAYGAVKMLGEGEGKTSGFTVNGKYVFQDETTLTLATPFEAALESGDSVDFFWVEDVNNKDTVAFFTDSGRRINSLKVKAGEEVSVEGLVGVSNSNSRPVENAILCSVDASGRAMPLSDAEGNRILTNKEGKAVLSLSEGIYTLTVLNGDEENGSRIIMPCCIVTVGHALEKVEKKEATAAEAGNIEYWYCNSCGKYFLDEKAEHEIAEEDTVLAKLATVIKEDGATVTVPSKTEKTTKSSPHTGDKTELQWSAILMLVSICVAATAGVKRKTRLSHKR